MLTRDLGPLSRILGLEFRGLRFGLWGLGFRV